jgi:hypothetical protein
MVFGDSFIGGPSAWRSVSPAFVAAWIRRNVDIACSDLGASTGARHLGVRRACHLRVRDSYWLSDPRSEQSVEGDREGADAATGGVEDGVCDGCRDADEPNLADALGAGPQPTSSRRSAGRAPDINSTGGLT